LLPKRYATTVPAVQKTQKKPQTLSQKDFRANSKIQTDNLHEAKAPF